MTILDNNSQSIISIVKESFHLLSPQFKKKFYRVVLLTVFAAVIDVISFAAVIPVIYLINDSSPVQTNVILNFFYEMLGFSSDKTFIAFILLLLALVFALKNLILLGCTYLQNRFIYSVASALLDRQLNRFYNNPYLYIKQGTNMEYLRYIANAPHDFANSILLPLIQVLYEIIICMLILLTLLIYIPKVLVLVILVILPVSYYLIRASRKRLTAISSMRGKLEVEYYQLVLEGINAYTDIKLFGKEGVFMNFMKSKFIKLYELHIDTNILQLLPRRIVETIVIFAIGLLYVILSLLFNVYPTDQVLILIAFSTAAYRLMPSVNEILYHLIRLKASGYILTYLSNLRDAKPDFRSSVLQKFSKVLQGEDISFRYPGSENLVLSGINFEIKKGSFVVVTGESGSGKTTFGKVLTGFIIPDIGKYSIDEIVVNNHGQVKHLMGYVTQDFYLFDRSLLENIALGERLDEIDMDRVSKVIELCNLSDLVRSLSEGVNYRLGEAGSRLSGGQKQRLAIARALYKQAQILVLDEITSALDIENESEILDTIYRISKQEGITVILITHRISSLRKYDAHFRMENGRPVSLPPDNIS